MKKKLFLKFFVFAVIGSLLTFTSCKDYDDDINNLQNQIEKLASKDDLTSQLSTLQSAITAAQTAASNAATKADQALAAAQAVGDVEAIAKAEAEAAAAAAKAEVLTELAAEIEALKAELAAANEAEFEAIKAELNTKIDEIAEKAENALGLIAGAVFDVELIPSETGNNEIPWITNSLNFSTAYEKDNVFEENIDNAITFVKDTQVQTGTSFIIRVSPTNVIVTPEMISFQNSLGQTYDNVKVTKVVPYEGLLTRSTANGGGLWEVFVELGAYNKADFDAASIATTTPFTKRVLYAVAVTNKDNKVISSYDIDLNWAAYTPAKELFFFVGDKHVKDVNNRYANTSISLGNPGSGTVYAEKTWLGAPAVAITTSPANTRAATTVEDNRSLVPVYPAVQGQALKISLTQALGDAAVTKPTNIRGLYVTLDKDNAIDSAPSELNAWNSYNYNNTLNTVVEGTEHEIIINSTTAINDIIGFRVYAVNYDGTLVDPDGKAFYVSLGKEATNWNAVNTVVTATQEGTAVTTVKSAVVNASLSKLTGAATYEWKTDLIGNKEGVFNVHFMKADGTTQILQTAGAGSSYNAVSKVVTGPVTGIKFEDIAKVYTRATDNDWLTYKDDHAYNGKLTIKNATGHVLATLDVTFKKELPGVPAGFSVKDKQIVDGVLKAYMLPTAWDATTTGIADKGTLNLYEIFNYPNDNAANFETTFATSTNNKKDPLTVVGATSKPNDLTVENSYIDNTTEHATKVVYDYGKISTETKNSAGAVSNYIVTVKEFNTVYSNIYNSYNWEWATREQLISLGGVYKSHFGAKTGTDYTNPMPTNEVTYGVNTDFALTWIYGVSSYDGKYNRSFGLPYDFTGGKMYKITNVKLVSNTSDVEEYFTSSFDAATGIVKLTKVEGGANNPTSNVPSTLKVEGTDMYGKAIKFETPVIVKPRTTP